MRKISLLALICSLALAAGVAAQQGALQTAASTLGVANIKTLQYTGAGRNFSIGQNYTAAEPRRAAWLRRSRAHRSSGCSPSGQRRRAS